MSTEDLRFGVVGLGARSKIARHARIHRSRKFLRSETDASAASTAVPSSLYPSISSAVRSLSRLEKFPLLQAQFGRVKTLYRSIL